MKILVISTKNQEYSNILEGWTNALRALGNEVFIHDNSSPIFRSLDQLKPDLLILTIDNVNRGVKKAVEQFRVKTVIWTDRAPEGHQKLEGAIWTSHDPSLNMVHIPIGFDSTLFKNNNEPKNTTICICNRELTAVEGDWLRATPTCRVYSSTQKRIPNFVGKVKDRYATYVAANTIYALDVFSDIGNMQACGAHVQADLDELAGWVPPYDSYTNIMKNFLESIS